MSSSPSLIHYYISLINLGDVLVRHAVLALLLQQSSTEIFASARDVDTVLLHAAVPS
jgi:hypothetical protein